MDVCLTGLHRVSGVGMLSYRVLQCSRSWGQGFGLIIGACALSRIVCSGSARGFMRPYPSR